MKKLMVILLTSIAASSTFASSANVCEEQLRDRVTRDGFMRLERLTDAEAIEMAKVSPLLGQPERYAVATSTRDSLKEIYLLETTEYSGVKQELVVASKDKKCKVVARYTTYLE